MFRASLIVAAAAALPLAAPAQTLPDLFTPPPSVSPTPYPEIGRTRSSYCRPVAADSAKAAAVATDDDKQLIRLVGYLPEQTLDDDPKPKAEKKLAGLRDEAASLRMRAADGLGSVSRIRAYAGTLTDLDKRVALTAYADAMESVLREQQQAGEDLARGLVIAEGRRAAFEAGLMMQEGYKAANSTQTLDEPGSYHYTLGAIAQRLGEHETAAADAEKTVAARSQAVHC